MNDSVFASGKKKGGGGAELMEKCSGLTYHCRRKERKSCTGGGAEDAVGCEGGGGTINEGKKRCC